MPIELSPDEELKIPEQIIPAVQANVAWVDTIVIYAPMGGTWSAVIESHPTDGKKVYYRDNNGNDTLVRIESKDLQADMEKDPSIAGLVKVAVGAITAITGKIKVLRDSESLKNPE